MKPFTVVFGILVLLAAAATAVPKPHSPSPRLFVDRTRLELRLEAPFSRLFAASRIESAAGDTASVDGVLTYREPGTGRDVSIKGVTISVRGNTSRRDSECTFPKLKLAFADGSIPADSLFAGIDSLKIGTHCGDRPDGALTKLGRWANDKSPIREAFVYQLLEAIAVPSLKARPATITYIGGGAPLVRGAMLLEDERAAAVRLGGTGELKNFRNARENFATDDAAALAFAQAMIGNFDWAVKFSPGDYYRNDDENPLWNVLAIRKVDGSAFPLMYDFDLAGPVAGSHPWFDRVYFDGLLPSRSRPAIEVLGQVQRTRTLFSREVLDRVRRRFLAAKASAYRTIDEAVLDDAGRKFARAYLDSFFAAIATDDAFYRPVVVRDGLLPYATAEGEQGACGAGDRIPVGTGVTDPVARHGNRIQVALLDVWWHWASRCDAVHKGPVWVDANAIGREYPPDRLPARKDGQR